MVWNLGGWRDILAERNNIIWNQLKLDGMIDSEWSQMSFFHGHLRTHLEFRTANSSYENKNEVCKMNFSIFMESVSFYLLKIGTGFTIIGGGEDREEECWRVVSELKMK